MSDVAARARRSIFFSYTGDLELEAKEIRRHIARYVDADIQDWILDPEMIGPLLPSLQKDIKECDVFIALISDEYAGRIGAEESEYVRKVWGSKRRIFVPFLFCQEGHDWWQKFANDPCTPEELRDTVWHSVMKDGKRSPFHLDGGNFEAILHPTIQNKLQRLTDRLKSKFETWDAGLRKLGEGRKSIAGRGTTIDGSGPAVATVYVMGGIEKPLAPEAAAERDALMADIGASAIAAQVTDIGDEWGSFFKSDDNEPIFEARQDRIGHVVAVGDDTLLEPITANAGSHRARLETRLLSEIDQNVKQSDPSLAEKARRFLWFPSYSAVEAETANDNPATRLEYHGGSAADMAGTIRDLLGIDHQADLIVQNAGEFKKVQDWTKTELPPQIHIDANSAVFSGVDSLMRLLQPHPTRATRPIIVAIGDKSVRASTTDDWELKDLFRDHLREYESKIEKLNIENDEGRIFRVFLQYQHCRAAAVSHEVNSRTWEVLRFEDPINGVPCKNCLRDLCGSFKGWYGAHWGQASQGPTAA